MVTQPAIFVTELALGYTLVDYGIVPTGLAGHSIGEFVAATLAGVFAESDALELIATRARLSAEDAVEGRMLAVSTTRPPRRRRAMRSRASCGSRCSTRAGGR